MKNKRKLKKIALLSEFVSLEQEEVDEQAQQYAAEFNIDFKKELEFLEIIKRATPKKQEEEVHEVEVSKDKPSNVTKTLHKKLAKLTHPDLNPEREEDFKEIQRAYEERDTATLIRLAAEENIDVEVDEEELFQIENKLMEKKNSLGNKKETCQWVWCQSDKNEELKAHIRYLLGIDEGTFQNWLVSK